MVFLNSGFGDSGCWGVRLQFCAARVDLTVAQDSGAQRAIQGFYDAFSGILPLEAWAS